MAEPAGSTLVLASASPRRLALLRQAGLEPVVRAADIDESFRRGEAPTAYVARLARDKAAAVARRPGEVVLAADTTVVRDGQVLGKPRDARDARAMLSRLAGGWHEVLTGVAVVDGTAAATPQRMERRERTVRTRVEMVPLTRARIDAYVATGEPMGKAGGYAIQGRAAAFVARIDGSYTGVVGLPLAEALALLHDAGLALP